MLEGHVSGFPRFSIPRYMDYCLIISISKHLGNKSAYKIVGTWDKLYKTFNLVAKMPTIWILVIAATPTTNLSANLMSLEHSYTVWFLRLFSLVQHQGFQYLDSCHHVCLLKKTIYGFNNLLDSSLLPSPIVFCNLVSSPHTTDPSLLLYNYDNLYVCWWYSSHW